MALIQDESKDMLANCELYYYIKPHANVKKNFSFFFPKKVYFYRKMWYFQYGMIAKGV